MFGWLKRKAQLKIIASMEQDISRFIAGLKGASAQEVGMIVLGANHWRNVLESKFGWNLDHPDIVAMRDIGAAVTLNGMIRDVQKVNPAMAPGLMVWLHSVRASQTPEIRALGREMWSQLARGIPHVEETAHGLVAHLGVRLDPNGYDRMPENLGTLAA
jgi:hypothetical protein